MLNTNSGSGYCEYSHFNNNKNTQTNIIEIFTQTCETEELLPVFFGASLPGKIRALLHRKSGQDPGKIQYFAPK